MKTIIKLKIRYDPSHHEMMPANLRRLYEALERDKALRAHLGMSGYVSASGLGGYYVVEVTGEPPYSPTTDLVANICLNYDCPPLRRTFIRPRGRRSSDLARMFTLLSS